MLRRWVAIFLCSMLLSACAEDEMPFPFRPNLPTDFNRSETSGLTGSMEGAISMFSYEKVSQEEGVVMQRVGCFDTAGRCIDYYYRDPHNTLRYHFSYDTTGRRVEELCYLDSAGTSYDDLTQLYTKTTYRYGCNYRTCRATMVDPNGRKHSFRLRYNGQGQLTKYIFPDGSRISYEYDADGQLAKLTYPDASEHVVQEPPRRPTAYDSLGRVTEEQIGNTSGLVMVYYSYDDHNNWIRRTTTGDRTSTTLEVRAFEYYE